MVGLGLVAVPAPAQVQPQVQVQPQAAPVVGVDALSEVRPEGARVVAVAVELTEELPADLVVPVADLTVTVGDSARTVQDVYVTDTARTDADEVPGRYLHIALDPTEESAQALYPEDLVGEYTVSLASPVTGADDVVLLPAFDVVNRAVLTDVVDDFTSGTFTGSSDATLTYRLFTPAGVQDDDAAPVPLVVFLHGGGEVGDDNVAQLTANRGAVAFAEEQWQSGHPAYVLAPQLPLPEDSQWEMPGIQTALAEMVDEFAARPTVDEDRLYLSGLSRGARGALQLLPTAPERFAGALLAAGRASQDGSTEHVAALVDLPLWATHAIDDDVVSYEDGSQVFIATLEEAGAVVTRGTWSGSLPSDDAEAAAAALLQEARAGDSHTLFTTFAAGTTPVGPHHSWIPTFDNHVMLEWLFTQQRSPEEPAPTPTPTSTPSPTPSPTTTEPDPEPTDTAGPGPTTPSSDDATGGVPTTPGSAGGSGQLPSTGVPVLGTIGVAGLLVLGGLSALVRRRR